MTIKKAGQGTERSERSGVMTVTGPITPDELGITLMHEHVFIDASSWWRGPESGATERVSSGPVDVSIVGELRMDPFSNKDNCELSDFETAVEELGQFRDLGGRTVVETTSASIGRDPRALRRVSEATGLQIVMGSGFYLVGSQPARVQDMSIDDIAAEIVRDASDGVDGSGVRSGIIGEIGVGADFGLAERKSLRGAARAQRLTGLPLSIHLPGWRRYAHKVLDIVAEEGGDVRHTILCHMNPSGNDFEYQASVAERGAYLEYDMVGMDYYYADQDAQSPSDDENARNIARLFEHGYRDNVLVSQDVFLKMMLTRNGGFGYGYILRHFVPRLRRHGLSQSDIDRILIANPRSVFDGPPVRSPQVQQRSLAC